MLMLVDIPFIQDAQENQYFSVPDVFGRTWITKKFALFQAMQGKFVFVVKGALKNISKGSSKLRQKSVSEETPSSKDDLVEFLLEPEVDSGP